MNTVSLKNVFILSFKLLVVMLGRVLFPLWCGYIYDINIAYPFFSGAATLALGLLVSLIGLRQQAVQSPLQV